jgi:TetR/AcrR family transcriptional regulator, tetracycline repressor protein
VARIRPRLTRDMVLEAALGVIDESGLEACTMRAVATELGVEAMSLYWHVPGKDALLDGVVGRVLSEVAGEREDVDGWRENLAAFAHAFRAVMLRHPNVTLLIAARPLGAYAAAARMTEQAIARLEANGFARQTAIRAARSVARYVVGFVLAEVAGASRPEPAPTSSPALDELLAQVAGDDSGELFGFGLDVMLDGLGARLSLAPSADRG